MTNARQATAKKPPRKRDKKMNAETRHSLIAEAAYYRAEQEGFSGDALQYWLDAEIEIDGLLKP